MAMILGSSSPAEALGDGLRAEDLAGRAAVDLDVLVSAVLVGKAAEELPAREAAGQVANAVDAIFGLDCGVEQTNRGK